MMVENFVGSNSLSWHLWSLSICKTVVQALLAFRVSTEKSHVLLKGLPSNVT